MEKRSKLKRLLPILGFALLVGVCVSLWSWTDDSSRSQTVTYKNKTFEVFTVADSDKMVFAYKDSSGKQLRTFKKFKEFEQQRSQQLVFAVNGGMFTKTFEPLGLYIEQGIELQKLRLGSGYGNFHLQPNGVFGMDSNGHLFIEETMVFNRLHDINLIKSATQSGPLLVINKELHPAFIDGSKNLHIRNGVGINNKGEAVFVISNEKTNFYDFATLFRDELQCKNALYLDGAISKMYNLETSRDEDGAFGVMIGVIE
jgi:uncharacterized protein YigE (DUF2233 family)